MYLMITFSWELIFVYLGYEVLIGVPMVLYFYSKNTNMDEGVPQALHFFPFSYWLYRKLMGEPLKKGLIPRMKIKWTGANIVLLMYGLVGVLFLLSGLWIWAVGTREYAVNDPVTAILAGFADTFLFLLVVAGFAVYVLVFFILYYFLILYPAKKKEIQELQDKLWEARNKSRVNP